MVSAKTPREVAERVAYRAVYCVDCRDPTSQEQLTTRLIEAAIIEAVKQEREACAKIADSNDAVTLLQDKWIAKYIAGRIRDRGEKETL